MKKNQGSPEKFPMRVSEEMESIIEKPKTIDESTPEPKTADGNKVIADKYIGDGHVHQAITRYKKAARLENNSAHRTDLGDAYAFAELSSNAIKQYHRAMKSNPNDPEPYFGLAELYIRYGKWHLAIEEYLIAVSLMPQSSFYRYKLASAYIHIGSLKDAIDQMVEAAALNPNDSFYRFELASMYADDRRDINAVNEMERAIELSPNDDFYIARLALLYVRISEMKKGLETMKNAFRINPQKHAYAFLLAEMYNLVGHNDKAAVICEAMGKLSRYDEDFIERSRRYMQGEKW